MPTGKVKFFDEKKGFGFIDGDDGVSVYLPADALPAGVKRIKRGTRVDYSVADTRRGPEALTVEIVEPVESLAHINRRPPEDMVPVVEDLIRLLDSVSGQLRRGRYPEGGRRLARALRALADEFDG
ncbi:cold shock protein (beta-ribbon, CspA family) [Actinobaculum suis]|uniref:Cold shock domain-containing protein n=1 Tax=Actinobaculum suis TaxID=1657 RepID=A0A0K9EV54_9ACTO|nr:cold shock domain-containing protein [Actinobaculum suis]KMY23737.1 cold-shock protein [Actinobaculum suis]MDY5153648.1 cold shock domain-containing protein [Actinobaculum suis]OCA93054.1 cold-shock protein [Actinobaculum suis]OCA93213.1 cold-shock protein [Actinobaculum suis]SDE22666.1 cold shock protein (beta-ribbon, CspA family) [Actinobaculum suis]